VAAIKLALVGPAAKEKKSAASKAVWALLSPEERRLKIDRMVAGQAPARARRKDQAGTQ